MATFDNPEDEIVERLSHGDLEFLTILYDIHLLTNTSRMRIVDVGELSVLHCIAASPFVGGGDETDAEFNRLKSCVDFLIEHGFPMNVLADINGAPTPENALFEAILSDRPRLALYLIEKGVEITPSCLNLARDEYELENITDNRWVRQLMARLTTAQVQRNIPAAATARAARRVFTHRTGINQRSNAGRTLMQMIGGPGVLRFGNAGAHIPAPRGRKTRRRS
jgi:hypothetical protein